MISLCINPFGTIKSTLVLYGVFKILTQLTLLRVSKYDIKNSNSHSNYIYQNIKKKKKFIASAYLCRLVNSL